MEKYKDLRKESLKLIKNHQHKSNPNLAMMVSIAIICAALCLQKQHFPSQTTTILEVAAREAWRVRSRALQPTLRSC